MATTLPGDPTCVLGVLGNPGLEAVRRLNEIMLKMVPGTYRGRYTPHFGCDYFSFLRDASSYGIT